MTLARLRLALALWLVAVARWVAPPRAIAERLVDESDDRLLEPTHEERRP